MILPGILLPVILAGLPGSGGGQACDLVIRNAVIYDGTGAPPRRGDIAVNADTIASVGPALPLRGSRELDVHGLAVSPGFVNMLSHSEESLIADGRSESDIRQGVTLEVFGESSMRLDDAGGVPGPACRAGYRDERRVVYRRRNCARERAPLRRAPADTGGARAGEGARQAGDGGGGAGAHHGAALRA